jgi:tetratricopeptide (TPR) repeat protein
MTEKPEMKAAIAEQSRLAEEKVVAERAALRVRINAIYEEGVALFTADRLDDALVKFREVVVLDAFNWSSRQYIDSRIPARRVELQELAAAEAKAKEMFDGGCKLFASGDIRGAVSAWNSALKITQNPELTASINTELRLAEEKCVKAENLVSEGIVLFHRGDMDASEAKFRDALAVDPMQTNAMDYLDVKVPAMRAELQRRAAQEVHAKEIFEKGNGLYASGDVAGARAAWATALSMTEKPALQESVTARVRMADEKERQEAAALKAKVAGIYAQGEALFNAGSLNESEAKFREVLAFDASHWGARQYLDARIPARKLELQNMAEAERRSKEVFEQGNKLYAAGDFDGAKAAWKAAARITEKYR